MQTEEYRTLGLDLNFQVPSSLDEAIQLYGADKVFEAFKDKVIYYGTLGTFRAKFASKLAELTGVVRKQVQVKNDKGEDVKNEDGSAKMQDDEKDQEFVKRALAQVEKEVGDFQDEGQAIADAIPFNPLPTPKLASSKKLGKAVMDATDKLIGSDRFAKFAKKYFPGVDVTTLSREQVGSKIAELERERLKNLSAQY